MAKSKYAVLVLVAALAAGAALVFMRGGKPEGKDNDAVVLSPSDAKKPAQAKDGKRDGKKALKDRKKKRGKPLFGYRGADGFDDPDHPYSSEHKRIAKSLQEALDENSEDDADGRKRIMAAAAAAAASDNPSLRERAIEAYSWIGQDALAELTMLMGDKDSNVAEQAIDAVEQALVDVDDAQVRFELATAYMSTFSSNNDAASMLGGISSGAALEFIEAGSDTPEEVAKSRENRQFLVETIDALIKSGNGGCAEKARELYEDVTGERWIDAKEAALWAHDPDKYEAPEEE